MSKHRVFRGLGRVVFIGFGMLVMYGSWVLEHPERYVQYIRVLYPRGYTIISCYEKLSVGEPVTQNDDGFTQVTAILAWVLTVHIPGELFPQLTYPSPATELLQEGRLKILEVSSTGESSSLIAGGVGVGPAYLRDVRITYSLDQEDTKVGGPFEIASFRNELVELYVDNPVFRYSFLFFVFGLVVFVVSTVKPMQLREAKLLVELNRLRRPPVASARPDKRLG